MARRESLPTQGLISAALLLVALLAAPVFAASEIDSRCDQVESASLDIPLNELNVEIVNHDVEADTGEDSEAAAHYLAPQVEAALRRAFEDSARLLPETASDSSDEAAAEAPDEEKRAMKMRLPGVTDSELQRYRQQMYRIDI